MARYRRLAILLVLFFFIPASLRAEPDKKDIKKAIDRGARYLLKQQEPDGSWQGKYSGAYDPGETALCTLALLKAGIPANHPRIIKAFNYIQAKPFKRTYTVALCIMAVEARYTPPKEVLKKLDKPPRTVVRAVFRKRGRKQDRQYVEKAVAWLLRAKNPKGWRYGVNATDFDNSVNQYAMLALGAAMRLGVKVPPKVLAEVARIYLNIQEEEGPEVKPFPIPAADGPLDEAVRKHYEERRQREARDEKGNRGTVARGGNAEVPGEKRMFRARGWCYTYDKRSTGAMTASGIAALVVAKAGLERYPRLWDELRDEVNEGIRDGVAWLARHFSVEKNPSAGKRWHYYWLYGAERSGMLAATHFFGKHDWYVKGATYLLENQKSDGNWPEGHASEMVNTAFAMLFLARGTLPARKMPKKRVITGPHRK